MYDRESWKCNHTTSRSSGRNYSKVEPVDSTIRKQLREEERCVMRKSFVRKIGLAWKATTFKYYVITTIRIF